MHTAGIEITGLSAGYRGNRVIHEVTASLPGGRITALLGPNGSGKSTLLAVLGGIVAPMAGSIAGRGGSRPALVVQQQAIPATLPITVGETVVMGRWAHRGLWRRITRADRAIVAECLARMEIADLVDRRLDTLSGGQRQRVLLARALAQQSGLLLLDEPGTGLDAAARTAIAAALRDVAAAGVTVVHATHDATEARAADHCLLLRDGRVVEQGNPGVVLTAAARGRPGRSCALWELPAGGDRPGRVRSEARPAGVWCDDENILYCLSHPLARSDDKEVDSWSPARPPCPAEPEPMNGSCDAESPDRSRAAGITCRAAGGHAATGITGRSAAPSPGRGESGSSPGP